MSTRRLSWRQKEEEEQAAMDETARRVEMYMRRAYRGRRCPQREYIIENLRRKYSGYGKRNRRKK